MSVPSIDTPTQFQHIRIRPQDLQPSTNSEESKDDFVLTQLSLLNAVEPLIDQAIQAQKNLPKVKDFAHKWNEWTNEDPKAAAAALCLAAKATQKVFTSDIVRDVLEGTGGPLYDSLRGSGTVHEWPHWSPYIPEVSHWVLLQGDTGAKLAELLHELAHTRSDPYASVLHHAQLCEPMRDKSPSIMLGNAQLPSQCAVNGSTRLLGLSTFLASVVESYLGRDMACCSSCLQMPKDLKRCARCHCALYCNRDCQLSHYKNGHKKECSPDLYERYSTSVEQTTEALFWGLESFIFPRLLQTQMLQDWKTSLDWTEFTTGPPPEGSLVKKVWVD